MRQELYNQAMLSTDVNKFIGCFDSGCNRCSLAQHDNRVVVARGNPQAKIMLIGEAPGAKEDQCGRPFSGPAGQLLDRIFDSIGMNTDRDLFITNVVFCRPVAAKDSGKQNYTPHQDQMVRCMPFKDKLIELVNPDVIIACGGPALKNLMDDNTLKITQLEGRWLTHKTGKKLFPMIHPAALLHQEPYPEIQKQMKLKLWKYIREFRDTWNKQ